MGVRSRAAVQLAALLLDHVGELVSDSAVPPLVCRVGTRRVRSRRPGRWSRLGRRGHRSASGPRDRHGCARARNHGRETPMPAPRSLPGSFTALADGAGDAGVREATGAWTWITTSPRGCPAHRASTPSRPKSTWRPERRTCGPRAAARTPGVANDPLWPPRRARSGSRSRSVGNG